MSTRCRRPGVLAVLTCLLATAAVTSLGAAPFEEGGLRVVPERTAIVSGEPLFLDLSITNPSSERLLIAMDAGWMQRVTIGEDGRGIRWPSQAAPEEPLVFSIGVDPHETKDITVAAVETASFREPGRYTMSIKINAVHMSATVQFVVLPYDALQLKARASELADRVIRLNDLEAAKALNSMPGNVAEPYLCESLKANAGMLSVGVPTLEHLASPESTGCLIDLLSAYKDPYRLLVANALRRIERSASLVMRLKIDAALASAK